MSKKKASKPETAAEIKPVPEAPEPVKKTKAKKAAPEKPKKLSALEAAAQVLADAEKPLNCTELIDAMTTKKLWTSPNGLTPQATLYAAISREISTKGTASRFKKAERGHFAANK